jgi:hypothetical protein
MRWLGGGLHGCMATAQWRVRRHPVGGATVGHSMGLGGPRFLSTAALLSLATIVDAVACLQNTSNSFGQCNTVAGKIPELSTPLPTVSIEAGLQDRPGFEMQLGLALQSTAAVQHATRTFGRKMFDAFVAPHQAGVTRDAEVQKAFGSASRFDRSNTGWVGPNASTIEVALQGGNIREVWALAYALTKSTYLDKTVKTILSKGASQASAELAQRGLAEAPLRARHELIEATNTALAASSSFPKYDQGMPDFAFPPFSSWVRFDFSARAYNHTSHNLTTEWTGARTWAGPANSSVPPTCPAQGDECAPCKWSDDPHIQPPLSDAELRYQCGGNPSARCRLGWRPGTDCYILTDAPIQGPRGGLRIPGYVERARALGYLMAAGPSGTTQNMLQYGLYLGMTDDWSALLRLSMLAWMLTTRDHSLYEIMLGADPYMGRAHRMVQGLGDLAVLCPVGTSLQLAGSEPRTFDCKDIWHAIATHVNNKSCGACVRGWTPQQQQYW